MTVLTSERRIMIELPLPRSLRVEDESTVLTLTSEEADDNPVLDSFSTPSPLTSFLEVANSTIELRPCSCLQPRFLTSFAVEEMEYVVRSFCVSTVSPIDD
jgi:hypothetical protein